MCTVLEKNISQSVRGHSTTSYPYRSRLFYVLKSGGINFACYDLEYLVKHQLDKFGHGVSLLYEVIRTFCSATKFYKSQQNCPTKLFMSAEYQYVAFSVSNDSSACDMIKINSRLYMFLLNFFTLSILCRKAPLNHGCGRNFTSRNSHERVAVFISKFDMFHPVHQTVCSNVVIQNTSDQ